MHSVVRIALCIFVVLGGPRFSKSNEYLRVKLNERVEFACNPSSEPSIIETRWTKDGVPLVNNGSVLLRSNNSTLVINKAAYDDEGVYTCLAKNMYNCDTKRFQLKVRSKLFHCYFSYTFSLLTYCTGPLTPLWPAIGIILELAIVAAIIIGYERYKKYQEKKEKYKPSL